MSASELLSVLVTPSREQILQMVMALAYYCDKGDYHCSRFNDLQLEAMGLYRQAIRSAMPDAERYGAKITILYRMAMTWGQVHNAMVQAPNDELFQLIWDTISCVYQSHPTMTAELQSELQEAVMACDRHDAIQTGLLEALRAFMPEVA